MQVTMYKDTQDVGDSVLIADNGKVSFIKGQPVKEQLIVAVLGAKWSDMPVHVELANRIKGDELCTIATTALGDDLPADATEATEFLTGLSHALEEAAREINIVQHAGTDYRKAIAMGLIAMDKYDDMMRNAKLASRDLGSAPPIVNLLVETFKADRFITTNALAKMLAAQRRVVETLQGLAKGEPGAAHAGVLALLSDMGMPVDACPCCGEESDHAAPGDNATGYTGHAHVPGNRTIN